VGVRQLEAQLSFPLFARNSRHVELTADGERLLPYFRDIVRASNAASAVIQTLDRRDQGTLRLGALGVDVANSARILLIQKFIDRYPKVDLVVEQGTSPAILSKLKDGELDAALIFDFPDSALTQDIRIPLQHKVAMLCIPIENKLSNLEAVPLEMLSGQDVVLASGLVCPEIVAPLRARLEKLSARIITAPSPHTDILVHVARVRRAVCFQWLPIASAGESVCPGDMVMRPIVGDPLVMDLSLVTSRLRTGALVRRLCEMAAQISGETGPLVGRRAHPIYS